MLYWKQAISLLVSSNKTIFHIRARTFRLYFEICEGWKLHQKSRASSLNLKHATFLNACLGHSRADAAVTFHIETDRKKVHGASTGFNKPTPKSKIFNSTSKLNYKLMFVFSTAWIVKKNSRLDLFIKLMKSRASFWCCMKVVHTNEGFLFALSKNECLMSVQLSLRSLRSLFGWGHLFVIFVARGKFCKSSKFEFYIFPEVFTM